MSINNLDGEKQSLWPRLKMQSADILAENIAKIGALFPNCLTERKNERGEVERAIDFDLLRQELSGSIVEGAEERYRFEWPDKKQAMLLAHTPVNKTLRPCEEESVGKDGTPGGFDSENLYIEGDNLEVLKLLRETYLGKVKMIYIDPPYNTGNDSVYKDDFRQNTAEYTENSSQKDEDGSRLVINSESNGRFHTDWLNMMYSRLRAAKDLLSDDGVIFISIDEHEVANLRKLCDEIFGEGNFITEILWEKKKKPSFLHKNVGKLMDYILCYSKNNIFTLPFSIEETTRGKKYPFNNAGNGSSILKFPAQSVIFSYQNIIIKPQDMSEGNIITELLDTVHIKNNRNENAFRLKGEFRYSQNKLNEIVLNQEKIIISKIPFRPNHIKNGGEIKKMKNVFSPTHYEMDTNEDATSELNALFNCNCFDNPKPVKLLNKIILSNTYEKSDSLILDFFSGSATTAHAVMQLNAEDGGRRRFIMVQLQEECKPESEAFKAGYKNICEIGKERIRRAGKKIKEENAGKEGIEDLDIGFRVLKCDSSNMKDVYYAPGEYSSDLFNDLADNIKEDRTPQDLLFQAMLELGAPLDSKISVAEIAGRRVFNVADNYLLACFDENVTAEVITAIASLQPDYFVMRDSSLADDSVAVNFEQIFKQHSPNTKKKVL